MTSRKTMPKVKTRREFIVEKAEKMGIPIETISKEFDLLKLSYKGKERLLLRGLLPFNPFYAGMFARNKELTKILLRRNGVRTPEGFVARNASEALEKLGTSTLSFPVVVKPLDAERGRGIFINIRNEQELEKAIQYIEKMWNNRPSLEKYCIVEERARGVDYRILVLEGKAIACIERIPASVTGDGKSTIEALAEEFNKNRRTRHSIVIDSIVEKYLQEQGYSQRDILPTGKTVFLRKNANVSSGGRAIDRTEVMSDFFKEVAERSASALGLSFCGVDILTTDITENKCEYWVLEINGDPSHTIHEKPLVEGRGVDTTRLIVEALFR
jgi:cyanophycin synthetase